MIDIFLSTLIKLILKGLKKLADKVIMSKALKHPVAEKIVIVIATTIVFSVLVFLLLGPEVFRLFSNS